MNGWGEVNKASRVEGVERNPLFCGAPTGAARGDDDNDEIVSLK